MKARLVVTFFAACLALAPLPGASRAGCPPVALRLKVENGVGYRQFYGNYNYAVGLNIQTDAQQARDERIANLVVQKLQALQQQTPQTLPQSMPDRWSLVRANCVKCHTETNEKAIAALYLGDLDALSCEEKLAMVRMVTDGKMPPNKPLAPDVVGNLLGQIAGATTAPGYSPQAVAEPQRMDFQVQAEPDVAPEPPKPILPKWKFAEGEKVTLSDGLVSGKVIERHRTQHLETGRVFNVYTVEYDNGHISAEIEERFRKYSEPEALQAPAEDVPPPPTPEPVMYKTEAAEGMAAPESTREVPTTTGIGGPELSNFAVLDVTDNGATFSWEAIPDAFVRVEIMGFVHGPYDNWDAKPPHVLTGLKSGEKYIYIVQAKDSEGRVGQAAQGSFTTK